jgi:hypothetical protein
MSLFFDSLRNEAGAIGKWSGLKLPCTHLDVQIHNKAGYEAKSDLGRNEPQPVDSLIEGRIGCC